MRAIVSAYYPKAVFPNKKKRRHQHEEARSKMDCLHFGYKERFQRLR